MNNDDDMEVTSAKYTDASRTHISAVINGQTVEVAAADRDSAHRRAIGDWESDGNVIGEPDAPATPGKPDNTLPPGSSGAPDNTLPPGTPATPDNTLPPSGAQPKK